MPGIAELPRWLWQRAGRPLRIAAVAAVLALVAAAVALVPGMLESKDERSEAERRERAEARAELVRRLRQEQRPRFGRSASVAPAAAPRGERLAARAALMDDLSAAVVADARARVRRGELDGPIRRLDCERFPRSVDTVPAHRELTSRRGRYSCVAVTSEFGQSGETARGVLGHTYRVLVDFDSGRYAFCKVSGQAGPAREQLVTTPRACGGR
jgi:hypothetical protein